jgi:hypothetical protein
LSPANWFRKEFKLLKKIYLMILNTPPFLVNKKIDGFEVDSPNSKKSFFIKKDLYYLELAQLVEILKVEGWWNSKGNMSITSKDRELIDFYASLFKFHKIATNLRVTLKVKVPIFESMDIKVFENGMQRKFNFGKNGFTGSYDRIVFNTVPSKNHFLIEINGQQIEFELNELNGIITTENSGVYIYYVLKASNIAFTDFLKNILLDKSLSHEIRINSLLKDASNEIIAKVFGILIDCEGSLRYQKFTRSIYVRMCNKEYLNDWNELLKKIGIKSRVFKTENLFELMVTCNQNFKKLWDLGFYLHNNRKRAKFENILNGYQKLQVERDTALIYYKSIVKANPGRSVLELSKIVEKDKRVVSHYLKILIALNAVYRKKITLQKYVYF